MTISRSSYLPAIAGTQSLILVEEITHRVLNEYTEALCALHLAAKTAVDPDSIRAIAAAAARLLSLAETHRALQAPSGDGPQDLGEYIGKLCERLAIAQLSVRGIRMAVSAAAVSLEAHRCWRVGLIVAELVRNAAKHGFADAPDEGEIRVDVEQRHSRILCSVCDDGRGVPGGGEGRGRTLVTALAAELGGSIQWCFTAAGCTVLLDIPVESSPLLVAGRPVRRIAA